MRRSYKANSQKSGNNSRLYFFLTFFSFPTTSETNKINVTGKVSPHYNKLRSGKAPPPKYREGIVMAFTRKLLESIGLSETQVSAVMDEHVAVTDALKADRDKYKAEADRLPGVQKELDTIKGGEDWKAKYENEHNAFESYKADQTARETAAKVRAAYRKVLIGENISEEWADKIVKLEDFNGMKLDADGNLADLDAIKERVKKEYGGYVMTTTTKGARVETPPTTSGKTMTKEEIMAIKDTSARQKAIAENLNLFGKGV